MTDADNSGLKRRRSRLSSDPRDLGFTQEQLDEVRAEMAPADDAAKLAWTLRAYEGEDDTAIADVTETWLESHDHLPTPLAQLVIERLRANTRLMPLEEVVPLTDGSLNDARFVVGARTALSEHGWLPVQVVDEALRRLQNALDAYGALTDLGVAVWPLIASSDEPAAVELRNRLSMGEFDR